MEMLASLETNKNKRKRMRWVKHYSSSHEILLVGDGDFSFSLSLANAFGSASNIVATSLDSHDTVVTKYAMAKSNLESLEKMGARILHGVDATQMKLHTVLKMWTFDRIIYNFPHAGFKGKEDKIELINLHQQLVDGFFDNARHMLRVNGQIHVTHKTEYPYNKWFLKELASKNSLSLIECADFNINDYPGYNNKRGDGAYCDQSFRLGKCCTYIFSIDDIHGKKKAEILNMVAIHGTHASWNTPAINHTFAFKYPEATFCTPPRISVSTFPQYTFATSMEGNSGRFFSPSRRFYSPPRIGINTPLAGAFGDRPIDLISPIIGINRAIPRVFGDHLKDLIRRFGPDLRDVGQGVMRNGCESWIGIGSVQSRLYGE